MMKLILGMLLLLVQTAWSRDLTDDFLGHYRKKSGLSPQELSYLSRQDIVLVPGILSELFRWEDRRGWVDFSLLTSEYFSAHHRHLKKLKLSSQKLSASSADIHETRENINSLLHSVAQRGRKALFVAHSLGGLVLLDYLLENRHMINSVEGIVFIQTPFYGSPIAQVYLDYPYYADKWLRPLLPFLNTSEETVKYLAPQNRVPFMRRESSRIKRLTSELPIITVSGNVQGSKSLFVPAIDIMKVGCIRGIAGKCLTKTLFQGPYDDSDGMVPLKSSLLAGTHSITLKEVDHGETVVNILGTDYDKGLMTELLLKLLLQNKSL